MQLISRKACFSYPEQIPYPLTSSILLKAQKRERRLPDNQKPRHKQDVIGDLCHPADAAQDLPGILNRIRSLRQLQQKWEQKRRAKSDNHLTHMNAKQQLIHPHSSLFLSCVFLMLLVYGAYGKNKYDGFGGKIE